MVQMLHKAPTQHMNWDQIANYRRNCFYETFRVPDVGRRSWMLRPIWAFYIDHITLLLEKIAHCSPNHQGQYEIIGISKYNLSVFNYLFLNFLSYHILDSFHLK